METINNYIRNNSKNILINNIEYNFNDTYRLHCKIKKLFLKIANEYNVKLFEYDIKKYNKYKMLIDTIQNNDTLTNYIYKEIDSKYQDKILGCNFKIESDKDIYLYFLIACISNVAEQMNNMDKYDLNFESNVINKLKDFIKGIPDDENMNIENFFEEFKKMTDTYANENNTVSLIEQKIEFNKKKLELEYKLNCTNFNGLFYKYFLLELVYYGYIYNENPKLKKICPMCKKIYYTKGKSCEDCAKKYANHRRKYNAKCYRRRIKIKKYLDRYDISNKLQEKANKFIIQNDSNNSYNDLKQLDKIITLIEKELNSN